MRKSISKKWLLTVLLCWICVFTFVPMKNVQAASNKTKALRAYRKLLSQTTIKRDAYTTFKTKDCRFALAYIDNNSIPELIVYCSSTSHIECKGALYTYRKGKLQYVCKLMLDTRKRLGYYPKTGWFVDNTTYQGYGTDEFYKLKSGKVKDDVEYFRSVEYNGKNYTATGFSIVTNGKYQEVSATVFNRSLRYNTNNKSFKTFKFYKNTKSNRTKYLK